MMLSLVLFCSAALALCYVAFAYFSMRKKPEGTAEMAELASIIRSGADTFMRAEFKVIAMVVLAVAVLFSLFIEKTSGITLVMGGLMSSLACVIGMKSATYSNVRIANEVRGAMSVGKAVKLALQGGSVAGICVPAFGILGLAVILSVWGIGRESASAGFLLNIPCNPSITRLVTYSFGCSLVAMFNRVAGGNYTKAADISSDILAKIRYDLPEDDSRVPNVIADFIGDNVNDIAGNCSDLLESFVATIVAGIAIAASSFSGRLFAAGSGYAIALTAAGLLSCLLALILVSVRKMGDDPEKELNLTTYLSAGLTVVMGFFLCDRMFAGISLPSAFRLGRFSPWFSSLLGIASGIAIGIVTEYYTSASFKPTRALAGYAVEGEAFVITKGDAIGSRSCLLPIAIIAIALFFSGMICGMFGIAMSAVGMLSFVGTTVSIDAFGPISDNAGGIAESCHLPDQVREITDRLDSVGNTTAAIGKGFAIGSAAFATVSLIVSYVGNYSKGAPVLNFASFVTVAGGLLGGALVEYFSALLSDNTIESARKMADQGDKLLSVPGVLEGKVKPDYNSMIRIATNGALRKMLFPSILSLVIPVVCGFLFGVEFVGGLLVGAMIVAIPRAIFMGNSGGAFDNAKKYIEAGKLEGHPKGSDAHKAAVSGDTVGDTRKDVVGVALDIFIKSMSTVANTLSALISRVTLIR